MGVSLGLALVRMFTSPLRRLSVRVPQRSHSVARLPYQHGYHAGNAADVLKHSILVCLLQYMLQKEKPIVYVDTHAGAGTYELLGQEASTLSEHERGIGLLRQAAASASINNEPLPQTLRMLLSIQDQAIYLGSPVIAQGLLRPGRDSLFLCERAPDQHVRLVSSLASEPHATALCVDGYKALRDRQSCPCLGKTRALVLVDPPYQMGSDTEQIARLIKHLATHWRSARCAIWYPITRDAAKTIKLHDAVRQASTPFDCLAVELHTATEDGERGGREGSDSGREAGGMLGSGMLLVQPPYGLQAELEETLLPSLKKVLRQEGSVRLL